jgi:hypothetical protein
MWFATIGGGGGVGHELGRFAIGIPSGNDI